MHIRKASILATLLLPLSAAVSVAQAPLEPAQLPSRTVFYVIWRGTPADQVRRANSLLSLWDDPGFAPVRAAMFDSFLRDLNTPKTGAKEPAAPLTKQDLEGYSALLENAFEFGYLTEAGKRTPAATPESGAPAHSWNGWFSIYDRTGKEAVLAKALLRMRAQSAADAKDPAKLSQVTVAGAPALKVEHKSGSSYWIEDGKFVIVTGEPAVAEEIIPRLHGKALGTATLAHSAAYQEAQPILGNGPIEFFLRIPDLKEVAPESTAQGLRVRPILDVLKLEAIHSLSGQVTFENARTHIQGAVLGDTAAGSLFDLVPDGAASPVSAGLTSPDTVYYNTSRINFQAVYSTVKRIAAAFFPKGQEGNVAMFEALAQTRIGRPVPEALALFTGEFGSIQNSPTLDQNKQVYFLGIHNKAETLKLLRTILAENIASERNEGDVTYLKVSLGGKNSAAGTMQYKFYNVAITPDSIIGATRSDVIKEVLAKRTPNPAWPAGAQNARTQFPHNLVGFNYVDLQHLDWSGIKEQWRQELAKAETRSAAPGSRQKPPSAGSAKIPAWFDQLDPQVLARHLHFASSASWKDEKGVHFEQWLE
jgi:hypothetical protein